jgi:hypothetical protein
MRMAASRIGWQVAAWGLLVALQVWSLQRIAQLEARLAAPRADAPGMATAGGPPPTPMEAAMAASLARIESRLAAGGGQPVAAAPVVRRQDPALAMPLDVADARLAALLPVGGTLREDELDALRARIMTLPEGERLPVSLALSRAINRGAVRITP